MKKYPVGECRGRWGRDVCGVLTMCPYISGITGGGVKVKGVQPGQDPQTLNMQSI